MAKLISVNAWITPEEGVLASTAQVLINVDRIIDVVNSPSGGAYLINGINSEINYQYNLANNLQNGSYFVTQPVSALLAAASV